MTSIKVKFRPSTVVDQEGTIFYQIIHERKVRQLSSDYHVLSCEWDEARGSVVPTCDIRRNRFLLSIRDSIRRDVERLGRITRRFDTVGLTYSTDDIIDEFNRCTHEYSLFNFMESIIANLRSNGKYRTSETYKSALNSFRKFLMSRTSDGMTFCRTDPMLESLDSDLMESYEAWHRNRGSAPNTISFYTRILRAVYNRAVEDEITENHNPFRHVYTGVDKTVKRALPIPLIRQIKKVSLPENSALDFARDMFLMSFYLRGMSFIDMCFLRKSDLRDGHVTYRRRKTGQLLSVEWTREMQTIIDKYPANTSDYLLPIIRTPASNTRSIYRNTAYNINRNLKHIARLIGLDFRLTMYVARHSWASAAKTKGIPISVISEGMGHDSEITTQIYLASLDTSVVDKANSVIIKSLY